MGAGVLPVTLYKGALFLLLGQERNKYTSYIFKTNYDKKLPYYFSNVNKFAELHLKDIIDIEHNGLFEKKQIQWMPLSKLKEDKSQVIFREFYKPLINSIIKNERFIVSFLQTMD
jgi:hypothetical protein